MLRKEAAKVGSDRVVGRANCKGKSHRGDRSTKHLCTFVPNRSYYDNSYQKQMGIYSSTKSCLSLQCCPKRLLSQSCYSSKHVPHDIPIDIVLCPNSKLCRMHVANPTVETGVPGGIMPDGVLLRSPVTPQKTRVCSSSGVGPQVGLWG
jgi:hypothetical protein